jgi:hypothetical protein
VWKDDGQEDVKRVQLPSGNPDKQQKSDALTNLPEDNKYQEEDEDGESTERRDGQYSSGHRISERVRNVPRPDGNVYANSKS